MKAFLSYQTTDRYVAAEVRDLLAGFGITSFMAHDDIVVSHEWQEAILDELEKAKIFIAILSKNYHSSAYCLQESGIAVFRAAHLTIIPLSIDGSVPPGFMAHIQAKFVKEGKINESVLLAGIAKHDRVFAVDVMVEKLRAAGSWASASATLGLLKPYLGDATNDQVLNVLEAAASNTQISGSFACRTTLVELLKTHGKHLDKKTKEHLEDSLL